MKIISLSPQLPHYEFHFEIKRQYMYIRINRKKLSDIIIFA